MKVFLSTPISCFNNKAELIDYKKSIAVLLSAIKSQHTVCAEIETIIDETDYDTPEKSIETDLQSIRNCDVFILHYPTKVPSSALIELGVAVALNKRILIITSSKNTLPYLALGIPSTIKNSTILEKNVFDDDFIEKMLCCLNKEDSID